MTPFAEYPAKGRGHRRRPLPPLPQGRGRPGLRLGRCRAGPRAPPPAAPPVDLPEATGRRDGSGCPAARSRSPPPPGPVRNAHAEARRGPPGLLAVLLRPRCWPARGCSQESRAGTSPPRALAEAKRNLETTSGVHIALSADAPDRGQGLLEADGIGTHAPAFEGTIKVAIGRLNADAAWSRRREGLRQAARSRSKFTKIDPADYGAPDPADLIEPDGGLSSLLTAAQRREGGRPGPRREAAC